MANFNFNKVILGGRLTADPELAVTPTGIPVCNFTMAINRRGAKDSAADFLRCQAWRATAEFVSRYFRKGSSICVVGSIQTRSWTDSRTGQARFVTEIQADEAFFVDSRAEMPAGQAVVTTDSPAMQGAGSAGAPPAAGVYQTPDARSGIEGETGEGDLPF